MHKNSYLFILILLAALFISRSSLLAQWQLGTTWYDCQHPGSQGKQIVVGDENTIHFTWMKGFHFSGEIHVVYACWQDGVVLGGNSVGNTGRSQYCTIDVLNGDAVYANSEVIAFQQAIGDTYITSLAPDYGPCWQAFLPFNHPEAPEWEDDQPLYAQMAIDYNNKVHVLATRVVEGSVYYSATADFTTWDTTGWIELPVSSATVSAVPVSSEFDGRVALLAHDYLNIDSSPIPVVSLTNDVRAFIAEDGDFTDWEQVTVVNVTDLLDSETTAHPLPGHVYGFCDIDGIFDSEGNLHVVYTTQPWWYEQTILDGDTLNDNSLRWSHTGQIWHALVDTAGEVVEYSHVAGYVGQNNQDGLNFTSYLQGDPGTWGSLNDRPSIAIDRESGALYCMWRSFVNLADTSAGGFSNADIWMRSSCDNGSSWGPAVNITDSQTPGCVPGECDSEAWGTLAEVVHEGLLHLEFVEDRDAGAITHDEGAWTDNPVWYLQVAVEDVPCGNAWDEDPHATHLTDSYWDWGALEDGAYEIVDEMHLLNEGRGFLSLQSVEVLYHQQLPDIDIIQLNGDLGDDISPYQTGMYQYVWNAIIDDDQHDAIIRFHTNGGTVDFRLANSNPLDLETAQSFTWFDAVPDVGAAPRGCPDGITLAQNYPNPFNPTTTIEYTLATSSTVQLEIYNTLGEMVAQPVDGTRQAGTHSVLFDGSDLASGIYLCRISADEFSQTRRMLLIK